MLTLRQLLQQASRLAIDDDSFDPMLGLQVGILALHAIDVPAVGNTPIPGEQLPDSVAGCVAMVFDPVIAMAVAGTWTGGDEFLLLLSSLRSGLPTESNPT